MKTIDITSKTILYLIIPILLISIYYTYHLFMDRAKPALLEGETNPDTGEETSNTLKGFFNNIGIYLTINTALIILIMVFIFLNS